MGTSNGKPLLSCVKKPSDDPEANASNHLAHRHSTLKGRKLSATTRKSLDSQDVPRRFSRKSSLQPPSELSSKNRRMSSRKSLGSVDRNDRPSRPLSQRRKPNLHGDWSGDDRNQSQLTVKPLRDTTDAIETTVSPQTASINTRSPKGDKMPNSQTTCLPVSDHGDEMASVSVQSTSTSITNATQTSRNSRQNRSSNDSGLPPSPPSATSVKSPPRNARFEAKQPPICSPVQAPRKLLHEDSLPNVSANTRQHVTSILTSTPVRSTSLRSLAVKPPAAPNKAVNYSPHVHQPSQIPIFNPEAMYSGTPSPTEDRQFDWSTNQQLTGDIISSSQVCSIKPNVNRTKALLIRDFSQQTHPTSSSLTSVNLRDQRTVSLDRRIQKNRRSESPASRYCPKQDRPIARIEYMFYVTDSETNRRPFGDRRIEAIGRASQCCITLHKPVAGGQPVFYKGIKVLPVTVTARTMVDLKRCLARIDMQYPYFNAKAFVPPDM